MTILIHAKYFRYTPKGYQYLVRDTNLFDTESLKYLRNFKQLPKPGTINNIAIDLDRNEWFQCGGYDHLHGLYLLEWDGEHVRKNL